MRKRKWLWIVAGLLVLLFAPYPTTVARPWRITIKDNVGLPVAKCSLLQYWQNWSVEDRSHEQEAITDTRGVVEFPRRFAWASVAWRIIGPMKNLMHFGIHASFGPSAYAFIHDPRYEEHSRGIDEKIGTIGNDGVVNFNLVLQPK